MKTIVAISTPIGHGGIAIVRLSGKEAFAIARKICTSKESTPTEKFEPRRAYLCKVQAKGFCDDAIVIQFAAPNSFTGEDLVEIHAHGGVVLAYGIVNACLANGAKMAENGEFSKRAFLNGKLSLDAAEGIIEMIMAESEAEANAGYKLLSGAFYQRIQHNQKMIKELLAEQNASLDYPGEDLEFEAIDKIKETAALVLKDLTHLLSTFSEGTLIKHGVDVAIVGAPNVGKSSLLNALVNETRAIVSAIPGTTRDLIKESYLYNGIKINLTDTAGIRETEDEIEKIGVKLAKEAKKSADIVLFIIDASVPISSYETNLLKSLNSKKSIVVLNKRDLTVGTNLKALSKFDLIETSTINKTGITELKQAIFDKAGLKKLNQDAVMLTNVRHKEQVEKAIEALKIAISEADIVTADCTAQTLQSAYNALGMITGEVGADKVIDTIFAKFCLGK